MLETGAGVGRLVGEMSERMTTPGTETIYVCTVPGTPPSLNEWQRWPWGKQERVRGEFQEMVWAVLSEKGNKCPRGFQRIECHAVLMFPRGARRDAANFGAVLWKLTLDVLVREGVISDDTAEYVTAFEPRIVTGDKGLTVLTIKGWRE